MTLWDPGYTCDDNRLRGLSYTMTDVFLLCFDVSQRSSFDRVETYWVPDLRQLQHNTPIILVALKTDLRRGDGDNISFEEGKSMAEKMGAVDYIEVSSLENTGVSELFAEAEKNAVLYNPGRN